MMTIKEMQKVYKKISKADNLLWNAIDSIRVDGLSRKLYSECAKDVTKCTKQLNKIASAMNLEIEQITGFATVDDFARFCFLNNIEYNAGTDDEENEADETEEA